jgi:hypothetical protein
MQFDTAIIAVHLASSNDISLTIVLFVDATVSIFSDFHFAATILIGAFSDAISVYRAVDITTGAGIAVVVAILIRGQ